MSDPNEQFNRGRTGQAPPSGGSDLDRWVEGSNTTRWNKTELDRQRTGGPDTMLGGGWQPFDYSTPPDPRILSAGLFMAASFIVFCLCAPIFGTLYPIPTAVAVATAFISDGFLRHAMPVWDSPDRIAVDVPAAFVVFWIASRLDHRVAAYVSPYRWLRHIARVVLIALLTATASLNPEGSLMPTNPYETFAIVHNPMFLPTIAVTAVVAHVGLTRWKKLRAKWDWGLEVWRLRPKGLPTKA